VNFDQAPRIESFVSRSDAHCVAFLIDAQQLITFPQHSLFGDLRKSSLCEFQEHGYVCKLSSEEDILPPSGIKSWPVAFSYHPKVRFEEKVGLPNSNLVFVSVRFGENHSGTLA